MKKKLFVLLPIIWICFFGVDVVYAEDPTPTPTITPRPGFMPTISSGLSEMDISSECPDGGVMGWGSCTPSPLWLQMCEHCVTGDLVSTPVPGGGGGDDPSGDDDENTSFWFPDTTEDLIDGDGLPVGETEVLPEITYYWQTAGSWYLKAPGGSEYVNSFDLHIDYENLGDGPSGGITNEEYLTVCNNNFYGDMWFELSGDISYGPTYLGYSGCQSYLLGNSYADVPSSYEADVAVNVYIESARGWGERDLHVYITNGIYSTYENNTSITWYQNYLNMGSGLYCENVVCQGESEYDTEFPEITFGSLVCFDIGPVEYHPLGWDIEIPHILHLCFQSISLSDVVILGVGFDLNIVLIVVLLGWLIMLLLQS